MKVVKMKVLRFWISRLKPHIVLGSRWPWTRPRNLGESKSKGLRWGGRYHTFSLVNLGSFELSLKLLILFVPFDSSEWEVLTIIYHHQKVKDVRLPVQLQRAMAAEAEAAREARAKVNIIAVVMVTLCIMTAMFIMVTIRVEEKHTKQIQGDRCRGRAQSLTGAQARCRGHRWESECIAGDNFCFIFLMLMLNEEYDYFGGIVDDGEFAFVRFTKKNSRRPFKRP